MGPQAAKIISPPVSRRPIHTFIHTGAAIAAALEILKRLLDAVILIANTEDAASVPGFESLHDVSGSMIWQVLEDLKGGR